MLQPYLEDLESRIDEQVEGELWSHWAAFVYGEGQGGPFSPLRPCPNAPRLDWPQVSINAAQDNFDTMVLQQLALCSGALAKATGELLCVRCNYGVGILPSLFGAGMFHMDEAAQTLPTSTPLGGGLDAIRTAISRGVPDVNQALAGRTLQMAAHFQQVLAPYPKIRRHVHLYHPDLQSPINLCELLMGSGMFLALIQEPNLVLELMNLLTETYIVFMQAWERQVPPEGELSVHWSMLHRGRVMLRDDSATNLSPDMFETFVRPFDQRILDAFGGGALHFCGRGDHYIAAASQMKGLYAVNMSQPELNDAERILSSTVRKGIKLIGLERDAAERMLPDGAPGRGNAHCWG